MQDKFKDAGANGERLSRLVFLDASDNFVAIIHRSVWMELLAYGFQQTPPINITSDLLGPLISQTVLSGTPPGSTYRDVLRKAAAFVSADQTLADAKAAMEAVKGCQDVIVTQNGAPTMPVIGWITNTDIGRLSQA